MTSKAQKLERGYLHYEEEPSLVHAEKAIFGTIICLSSAQNVQQNLPRIIVREIRDLSPKRLIPEDPLVLVARAARTRTNRSGPGETKTKPPTSSFLDRCRRLDDQGYSDSALDMLYDSIDQFMRDGRFAELNTLVESVDVESYSDDILLGLLTSTLPARTKLPSRKHVFQKIKKTLKRRNDYEEGMLAGLE